MKKLLFSALIVVMLFASLTLVSTTPASVAKAATQTSGIITLDTTWTKANSPYNLTGNLAIDKEVTLTIEPGTTVNLNGYYMRVNGTLTAKGTPAQNIYLTHALGSYIEFTQSSTPYNLQTGIGCIIENTIIKIPIRAVGATIVLNNNTITKAIHIGNSSIISKNNITIWGSDPASREMALGISGYVQVVDNTISGEFTQATIVLAEGSPLIQRNIITNKYGYGGGSGYGQSGIKIINNASPVIKQNTITRCANGISLLEGNPNPIITNNNFEHITNYNLRLYRNTNNNIDATNNWWGTTNTTEVDQKIYDFDDDFNLGKVNYTPLLTEPSSQAMPNPNAPTPTIASQPTTTPTQQPTSTTTTTPTLPAQTTQPTTTQTNSQDERQTEFYQIIIAALSITVAMLAVALILVRNKQKH